MVWKYPKEVHDFVKEHARYMRDQDLARECNAALGTNFTAQKMKSFRGNHGYRNYMSKQLSSEEYWKYQTYYPAGMYEFIRDNSWGVPSREMAEIVNEKFGTSFSASGMKNFRARHKIRSGVTGWYQKGHAPGTKGKTLEEICHHDPEKLARVRSTYFSKGHTPKNKMPIGTVLVKSDGYLWKKIGEGAREWKQVHIMLWEEANGPVPDGMRLTFKDGDRMNVDLANLALVTPAENAVLTTKKLRSEAYAKDDIGLNIAKAYTAIKEAKKRK